MIEKSIIAYHAPMELFSYQKNVLLAIRNDPSHSQMISMPTGTGKTVTFLAAIKDQNKKCLVLVHRQELLNQTYEKAILWGFSKEEISVISSTEKQEMKPLTIAMVQTLNRNLDLYHEESIEMMVVDEAHHATAKSYLTIFEHFKMFEKKKLLLGFTATPLRGDQKQLGSIFSSHSFKMTLQEATQNGYICPVSGIRIDIDKSLDEIETVQGDFDIQKLEKVMNCESVNELIVSKCQYLKNCPGIIFCTSVDHAQKLSSMLRQKKRKAISVSYLTSKKTLEKIYEKLKRKEIEFLTNAVKLSEGFDHPAIQSVILARPTRSPVLYKQMIGRGLRNYPDKLECLVLEFSGNDPSVISWEDLDQNCTFQSLNANEIKTREEALSFYKGKFTSINIKILDVRISPFKFYECKIKRRIKYGKYIYCYPSESGFCMYELQPVKEKYKYNMGFFHLYAWYCFWKDKYKTFYVWSEGQFGEGKGGVKEEYALDYMDCASDRFNEQKRWYPSEEQRMTRWQKNFLKQPIEMSARKAEMYIEDGAIKQAIKRYWIDSRTDEVKGESSHESKVYLLEGKY